MPRKRHSKAVASRLPKVSIGVACSSVQRPEWWSVVMGQLLAEQRKGIFEFGDIYAVSSALPDHNKNGLISKSPFTGEDKKRADLTDANRNKIMDSFLAGDSDYLMTLDDDTVPPMGFIGALLSLRREAVSGLYNNPKPPFNPIAYLRNPGGGYRVIWDYPRGTVAQVDSTGMGCTLIHRSVFEKIMDAHVVMMRPTGSIVAMYKGDIVDDKEYGFERGIYRLPDGKYAEVNIVEPIKYDEGTDDHRGWPFFAMEYGRTEDHHFWELAANVGVRPWLDTSVVCLHIKSNAWSDTDRQNYVLNEELKHEGIPPIEYR